MIRPRHPVRRDRPVVAHLTTTDISLALLLGGQLKAFAAAGYEVVGVSHPGRFVTQIEADGIRHIPLANATRSNSVASDLKAAAELWTVLRRLRPDVLHTHNPKPGVYGRIVGALAGVPVVVNTVHGLYADRDDPLAKRLVVYALERIAAAFSDAELVQNPEDLETLRRLRVPSRRLHLLGNGIDLSRFSRGSVSGPQRSRIRSELGASDDSVVVTSVGRLVREKGFEELFAAARALRTSHPRALFVVAGPADPSKQDAMSQADLDEAETSGVRLLGHRDDIEAVYAATDIFVLASHREGFPRSAMEASAMSLPVIASSIRGCRQVVDDGVTGLLVPARDPEALAKAIASLVDDERRRKRMGETGTLKAKKEFDQQRVIEMTLDVYSRHLGRRRAGRNKPLVVIACPGAGLVARGYESFAIELARQLQDRDDLTGVLMAGGRVPEDWVVRIPNWPRVGRVARFLGRRLRLPPGVIEQVSFGISSLPWLWRAQPDTILCSERALGAVYDRARRSVIGRILRFRPRLVLSNGGGSSPPYPHFDLVQHLTPVHHERALRAGEPSAKHVFVPYGFDPSPASFEGRRHHPRSDQAVVLSVGSLDMSRKRMDHVVKEVARLRPRPYLILLGQETDETDALRDLADKLLGPETYELASASADQVGQYYDRADVFVLASLDEAFGRVFVEALLRGLPAVAHNFEQARYVLGDDGIFVDMAAEGELGKTLDALLAGGVEDTSAAGRRERASARFSWGTLMPRYVEMLTG